MDGYINIKSGDEWITDRK